MSQNINYVGRNPFEELEFLIDLETFFPRRIGEFVRLEFIDRLPVKEICKRMKMNTRVYYHLLRQTKNRLITFWKWRYN